MGLDLRQKGRADLKGYFLKNAIPSEANFSDLIDSLLNQRDDGIVKSGSDPLSIEAAGDDTSQKKAINFYQDFADDKPSWVLSLRPRSDPKKPATGRPGFSIGDGDGRSRLFIESGSGRIGVGTVTPKARLHVAGAARVDGDLVKTGDWGATIGGTRHAARARVGELWGKSGVYGLSGLKLGSNEGSVTVGGNNSLTVEGAVHAGNSDLYFTKIDHNHSAFGNTAGYAAIENAKNYDALMILGRAGTDKGRKVRLWDYLEVNGDLSVTGWTESVGRRGRHASGTVPANGKWHRIQTKLTAHHGFELVADAKKSGLHGLTHAICMKVYMGDGANGGITKTQSWYGSKNGAVDVRWSGSTYNYNLEIRTLGNYGGNVKINYQLTKLW